MLLSPDDCDTFDPPSVLSGLRSLRTSYIIHSQVAQCAEEVERDLQLTGVTAIEDKLQARAGSQLCSFAAVLHNDSIQAITMSASCISAARSVRTTAFTEAYKLHRHGVATCSLKT